MKVIETCIRTRSCIDVSTVPFDKLSLLLSFPFPQLLKMRGNPTLSLLSLTALTAIAGVNAVELEDSLAPVIERTVPLRTHSLAPPYVDTDLQNRWWDFGGDAVIVRYIPLCNNAPLTIPYRTQTNMFASPKTNPPSPAGFGLACLFPYPTGKSMSSSKSMARRTISLEMVGHFG